MSNEQREYERWSARELEDAALTEELHAILGQEEAIRDRFGRDLAFGTAGLRGVLGAGTNRMNIYTVRRATQGLADTLKTKWKAPMVAIAYDSRINSERFAQEAARVLAANGVKVWLYGELMPTPALSFAVRELRCQAGINITASHNPAKYNGYKAYDDTGCQIDETMADQVMQAIRSTDLFDGVKLLPFEEGLHTGMIEIIGEPLIQNYLDAVLRRQVDPGVCKGAGLKVVYTPLNGAGRRCVLSILQRIGVEHVTVVPEQEWPDGTFPTCPSPNPEVKEAMALGLALAERTEAHLLLATDPDSDRVGIAVRHQGEYRMLTGNEVGVLLTEYIGSRRTALGTLPKDPILVKSIVTTTMVKAVAAQYGIEVVDVLTGFKYIGEQIAQLEEKGQEERFLLGFEESYGYLSGGYVRDKDAVNGSMLIAEMTAWYLRQGKTLVDVLGELYQKFGTYYNTVDSFAFEGVDGMNQMAALMDGLRAKFRNAEIPGAVEGLDYSDGAFQTKDGLDIRALPHFSNVIQFTLADGSTVVVRPSGTEPKLKVYYMVQGENEDDCKAKKMRIAGDVKSLLGL